MEYGEIVLLVINVLVMIVLVFLKRKDDNNLLGLFHSIVCKPGFMVIIVIAMSFYICKNSAHNSGEKDEKTISVERKNQYEH